MLRTVKGNRVLGIVLAGGEGKRLAPLTADRAKPAVPFGGIYRLVDFVLSNLVNGGYLKLCVLTQYKSHSLDRHITTTWRMSTLLGDYITSVPAQQRLGPRWYAGSADAIFQSLNLIYDEEPDYVVVFGADHVYRMDPRQMVDQHIRNGAGVTVAGIRIQRKDAGAFGIISTAADGRTITDFLEKPTDPPGLPDAPEQVYASMGNYVFTTDVLLDALRRDSGNDDSRHDMGGDVVPMLTAQGQAEVYDFRDNDVPGVPPTDRERGYWRDVGTLDAYYDAHQDLISVTPTFSLYNREWPILTNPGSLPPAKVVNGASVPDSLISPGVIVSGSEVRESVLSPGVRVHDGSSVAGSVIAHGVVIGPGAVVRRAILDKNAVIGPGQRVGVDRERDVACGATISDCGVTVFGKGVRIG
jgi:glucose-1-phosphate adenylyltransferase